MYKMPRIKSARGNRQFLLLIVALAVIGVKDESHASEAIMPGFPVHAHLMYDDLVVRGVVESIETELIPARTFQPALDSTYDDQFIPAQRLTVGLQEVMRGSCDSSRINIFVVRVPDDLLRVGDDVILAAIFRPHLLGGSYVVAAERACYVEKGSDWVCAGVSYKLSVLRDAISAVSIETLAGAASAVVVGVVESIRKFETRSTSGLLAVIQELTVQVEDVKRGEASRKIIVEAIVGGSYWPEWRGVMPRQTKQGDRLYLFLGTNGENYRVLGGANGCLKLSGSHVLYNDAVPLGFSVSELDQLVKSAQNKDKDGQR